MCVCVCVSVHVQASAIVAFIFFYAASAISLYRILHNCIYFHMYIVHWILCGKFNRPPFDVARRLSNSMEFKWWSNWYKHFQNYEQVTYTYTHTIVELVQCNLRFELLMCPLRKRNLWNVHKTSTQVRQHTRRHRIIDAESNHMHSKNVHRTASFGI